MWEKDMEAASATPSHKPIQHSNVRDVLIQTLADVGMEFFDAHHAKREKTS